MAVRYIGDPDHVHPSGGQATFRFFDSEHQLFAVVHNSHLGSYSVQETVTGASRFDISLKCAPEDNFAGIPEAAFVELFVRQSTPPANATHRLIVGIVDYAETESKRDAAGKRLLKLQGRSVWARLIDAPWRGRVSGQARDVFRALSSNVSAVADRDELKTTVDASFNCPSAYGAMRLLALSMDCVVENENGSLFVDTVGGCYRPRCLTEPAPFSCGLRDGPAHSSLPLPIA